jgi:hypothetical protein
MKQITLRSVELVSYAALLSSNFQHADTIRRRREKTKLSLRQNRDGEKR